MKRFNLNIEELGRLNEELNKKQVGYAEVTCDYQQAFSKNCNGICGNISNKKTK